MSSPSHPSGALLHCYLDECGQAPAPLAETKWLAGIWCNLHLSAKSWILFLWSRCWRAWQKAQLTGLHSWERCLWPTYRGSSSQLRATTLMENGETWYEVCPSIVFTRMKSEMKSVQLVFCCFLYCYDYSLIAGNIPSGSMTAALFARSNSYNIDLVMKESDYNLMSHSWCYTRNLKCVREKPRSGYTTPKY